MGVFNPISHGGGWNPPPKLKWQMDTMLKCKILHNTEKIPEKCYTELHRVTQS